MNIQTATPMAPRTRSISFWWYVAPVCFILWMVVQVIGNHDHTQADVQPAAIVAAFSADLQGGKLATPEAFQARCGQAQHIIHKGGETILTYHGGEMWVHMAQGQHVQPRWVEPVEVTGGGFRDRESPASPEATYQFLGCQELLAP
jgi:hypothetical protein